MSAALKRRAKVDAAVAENKLAAACLPAIYAHHTKMTDCAAKLAYEQADEMMKARAQSADIEEPGT